MCGEDGVAGCGDDGAAEYDGGVGRGGGDVDGVDDIGVCVVLSVVLLLCELLAVAILRCCAGRLLVRSGGTYVATWRDAVYSGNAQ